MNEFPRPRPIPMIVVGTERDRELCLSVQIPPSLVHLSEHMPPGFVYAVNVDALRFGTPPYSDLINERTIQFRMEASRAKATVRRKHVRRLRSSPRGRRVSGWVYL